MPLKIILIIVTALGLVEDTSIAKINLQVVTVAQLQEVINQLTVNSVVLDVKINSISIIKVKMPSVKRFRGEKSKLKGFLTQIKLKIRHKGQKLPVVVDQVVYVGLFLTGYILKQFKLYLTEYKANGLTTVNTKVKYIFLSQEGFYNRLI